MQPGATCTIHLPDEAATDRLGALLARRLRMGDTVLLSGPIGAGKSHLVRALIHERLGRAEEVPSPSFTLVQVYDAPDGEIWHADLYRLSNPDDVVELGLDAVFGTALCLVEWPDRLGDLAPIDSLRIALATEREGRRVELSGGRPDLIPTLDRLIRETIA